MPQVTFSKIQQEAPALAPTFRKVGKTLSNAGMKQGRDLAKVVLSLDHSGSTEDGQNRLYTPGRDKPSTMQYVTDNAAAAGFFFDDNGEIPASYFHTSIEGERTLTVQNFTQFVPGHTKVAWGGTSYIAVLRWIIEQAGFSRVKLGGRTGAKATAQYPTYAIVATDGEPFHDRKSDIERLLIEMSQLPIFVQFVGVGYHDFDFLRKLDTLKGRFIDNAGFFDEKDVNGEEEWLEKLLGEFAGSYYPEARRLGLVTG